MATPVTFSYTGAAQTYVVPAGLTQIIVECFGAQGGFYQSGAGAGGLGGYVKATIPVTPGETLNVYVGGAGGGNGGISATGGGYNGGGAGKWGGGGASDVRQGGTALSNRAVVAGGGGGTGANHAGSYSGGAGGGLTGGNGSTTPGYDGQGGTQSAGGTSGAGYAGVYSGSLGVGGQGTGGGYTTDVGGGGGGGYYGGGGGNSNGNGAAGSVYGSGGGGSGYVITAATLTSMTNGSRTGNGQIILTPATATPDAPTLNAPANNTTIDRTVTQRFAWTYSNPVPADLQSKFDLQYRVVSTTPWTTVTGTTPNQYFDFASGTFAAGNFEWQVRNYDSVGAVGPWSASGFFTAATPPTGPTITGPTSGSTIGSNASSLAWTYPTQSAYHVRKVADNAGVPDTATVYYDSGEITDSTSRAAALTFPVNGRYEHLQVLVRDSGSGLLSPYASVRVQVSYTPPAGPTVVATPNNAAGTISVAVTNPIPTGGQPTVNSWDIYRRVAGDGTAGVRIAASFATIYTDYTPASGVAYEYSAVVYGNNTTTASSAWTA